jgi:glycosyltransferase involved in cell wall biosynthesis
VKPNLKIWLVNTAERLSFDAGNGRRMRMGLLCSHLVASGARVTYWTSAFNHVQKVLYAPATVMEQRGPVELIRLRARGYRKHVSLARLLDHAAVAREFTRVARDREVPDLIICSYPTIEISRAVARYAARQGVPVIVDVRDMWPDLFHWMLPRGLGFLGRAALLPYAWTGRRALRAATTVTSITDGILDWALGKAGRPRRPHERAIHFCYEPAAYRPDELAAAADFWREQGVPAGGRPIVLFIGSFNRSFDLRPVIDAARRLGRDAGAPLFVLCGAGDMEAAYRRDAAGAGNVVMPGWVHDCHLRWILERATLAISPLPDRRDYRMTVNNKFVEYLSGAVPVLVAPADSYCAQLVEQRRCGRGFALAESAALAEMVRSALADQRLLGEWRANAAALFAERFAAGKVMHAWDELIAGTLAARPGPPSLQP